MSIMQSSTVEPTELKIGSKFTIEHPSFGNDPTLYTIYNIDLTEHGAVITYEDELQIHESLCNFICE